MQNKFDPATYIVPTKKCLHDFFLGKKKDILKLKISLI